MTQGTSRRWHNLPEFLFSTSTQNSAERLEKKSGVGGDSSDSMDRQS